MFRKPCLDCGQLTSGGNRCDQHEAAFRAKRNQRLDNVMRRQKKLKKYDAEYQKRARVVRATAIACHLCGKPFNANDKIQADHLYPDLNNASPLLPAHARCNAKRGNKPLSP